MKNQLMKRLVIGLALIAVLFTAYKIIERMTIDPDFGRTDTSGMIAAVEYVDGGSKIVLFDSSGSKTEVPGYAQGHADVEPVWRPDGQRLLFSSDRKGRSNNIFRWNIANAKVEQRSHGTRGEGGLYFGPPDWPGLINSGLITAGGVVLEFDQEMQRTQQVLPPAQFGGSDRSGEESGSGTMDAVYERIGTSFKSAMWGAGRRVVYSVMRREADEAFVVSFMEQVGDQPVGPVAVFAGQSIQFDVGSDGTAVVSIQGFEFVDESTIPPDFIQNGRAIKPYRNALMALKIGEDGRPSVTTLFTDQPDLGVDVDALTDALRLQDALPENARGLRVNAVAPDSAAARVGIAIGDVIQSVEGTNVTDPDALVTRLSQVRLGDPVKITYYSKNAGASKTVEYAFGQEPSLALREPAVSPDASVVAVTLGAVVDRFSFQPRELVLLPLGPAGGGARLVSGGVHEPSWSPDGKRLVYAKVGPSGDAQIYRIDRDGSNETNVSGPGEFARPRFSPMLKK